MIPRLFHTVAQFLFRTVCEQLRTPTKSTENACASTNYPNWDNSLFHWGVPKCCRRRKQYRHFWWNSENLLFFSMIRSNYKKIYPFFEILEVWQMKEDMVINRKPKIAYRQNANNSQTKKRTVNIFCKKNQARRKKTKYSERNPLPAVVLKKKKEYKTQFFDQWEEIASVELSSITKSFLAQKTFIRNEILWLGFAVWIILQKLRCKRTGLIRLTVFRAIYQVNP